MSTRQPQLSVIVPALNEAAAILGTLQAIRRYLESQFESWEILVVDDGSTDATPALVAEFADVESIHLLRNPRRLGKGASIRKGMLHSRGEAVLFTDADLSMPIEEATAMLAGLAAADVVIASKRCQASDLDYPLMRRLTGAVGQALIRWLVVGGISDTQGGFKLFKGDVGRTLFQVQLLPGFGFDFEVLFLAKRFGWTVAEVPFCGHHRVGGSISLRSYAQTLLEVGKVVLFRIAGRYPQTPPTQLPLASDSKA